MLINAESRIAILSPLFRNPGQRHGGITPVVLNLATEFCDRGYQVDLLIFPPTGSAVEAPISAPGLDLVRLEGRHSFGHFVSLYRYLRHRRPAALLGAGPRANKLALWAKYLGAAGARVVLSVHCAVTPGLAEAGPWKRWRRRFGLRQYRYADLVVAVSAGVAEDYSHFANLPTSSIRVIYNPIVTSQLTARLEEEPDHPWLRASMEPTVIVAVGRLHRQKDFATLLRAFALLRQRRPCRLIILGEGEEHEALLALGRELGIDKDIDLQGFVGNPLAYMARARLLALSSRWEGFGNVLVEAMAAGTPVVSTDCPSGPREILMDGDYGPLVATADPLALAKAMETVLDRPPERERLRARAAEFSAERSALAYLEALGVA